VAILDVGMPRMDGWSAGRALRKRPWADGLILYALTGWSQLEDRERTRDAGFDRLFAKPVEFEELLRDLHARVSSKDAQK
jgi:CheY-like chemotaxis protein